MVQSVRGQLDGSTMNEVLMDAATGSEKVQGDDVSGATVVRQEVRRSNRVKGIQVGDAGKQVLRPTTTKTGVDENSKTIVVVDRLPLQAIDTNIISPERRETKATGKSMFLHTLKFRSPYFQCDISTSKPLKKNEKELGFYAMYLDSGENKEILFELMDIQVRRFELLSMRRGNVVNISIIDAWTLVLNWKEQYRSNSSPLRFFSTASLYLDSIAPQNLSLESQRAKFLMELYVELIEFGKNPVGNIDMFFFPVYEQERYFALCVDLKRERIFVLDNLIDIPDDIDVMKYDSLCTKVRTLLVYYLNDKEETIKAKSVTNSKMHIVKLKWPDKRNTLDTAIYLMRHL
ncbi:uncharacterized protein LOC130989175 isoform X2 [Salvia miltiorrhiza]|nr:uncharacterized protein LOC130989175 isoform X2 [Salvia miltiorrhiza]